MLERKKFLTDYFQGEKAHLDAKIAPAGDPSIQVDWFCNGQPITASKSPWFGFLSKSRSILAAKPNTFPSFSVGTYRRSKLGIKG